MAELIVRQQTPQVIERGRATTLSITVYDEDGTAVTPTVGTFKLYTGNQQITLTDDTVTLGSSSTVSVAAADTSSLDLTDEILEEWTLTVSGEVHVFTRSGYLVRRAWWPTITTDDLVELHGELDDTAVAPTDDSSYTAKRRAAKNRFLRRLIRAGLNPHLMHDAWAFTDCLTFLTLHMIFLDFFNRQPSNTYKELADYYGPKGDSSWLDEFNAARARFDEDEDGTINDEEAQGAGGTVTMTAGNPGSFYGARRLGRGW